MRVSSFESFDMMKYNLNQIQQKQVRLQNQNATGKSFLNLSESPILANQSLIIKSSLNQIDQYTKNVNDAESFLSAVESNLGTVVDIVQQAKEQGLKAANGTYSQENRDSFASLLNQNIEQIVSVANAKFLGKQLFAGEKTQTTPFVFDGTTVTYNGNLDVPSIKVSPNLDVKISENGEEAFRHIFDAMIQLRDDVKAGNIADIETAIAGIDASLGKVIDFRSDIGVRMESMEMYKKNYEAEKLGLEVKQGDVEDVDFTKTMMDYAQTQRIQQGILATTQKMFSISLLNYI